jgi:hypothetical protein
VGQRFDFVITVCDQAREDCPVFAGEVSQTGGLSIRIIR